MNHFWLVIIITLAVVGAVVFGFTIFQVYEERASLISDLAYRTQILADSIKEFIEPIYVSNSEDLLKTTLNRFDNREGVVGLAVYNKSGNLVASSSSMPGNIGNSKLINNVVASGKPESLISGIGKGKIYQYAEPLHQNNSVVGVFLVAEQADYIDNAVLQIWKTNLLRLFIQVVVYVVAMALLIRWLVFLIIKSIRLMRSSKPESEKELSALGGQSLFKPLFNEVSKIYSSLHQARLAASEEAKLRLDKIDAPWTSDRLKEFIKASLKDRKIFVVSNREPYVHNKVKNKIEYSVPASGMVTALEPLMEACQGTWLAQATGNADKETADENGKLKVPPEDPKYTLKRIWLTEKEVKGFYVGFSNEAMWPLCHTVHTRPIFRKEDWQEYRRVNGKFAEALLLEIKDMQKPLILVQDFHFALLPQMIKKSRPDAQIGLFWHVPWPAAEAFNICPYKKEILEGMLGADILGFHTQQYCNNFMQTVSKGIESIVDSEQFTITLKGHVSSIKPFPISIAFTAGSDKESDLQKAKKMLDQFNVKTELIGLGVDRLDYTKGILERFKGIEFFFNFHKEYEEKLTFLQIAPPSREEVEKYRQFNKEVTAEAERINAKFSKNGWSPIVLVKKHLSHADLYPLYRRANFSLITPLQDGMNLVAKEFVAARNDEAGVIILSQFAGASKDLKGAIIINPYSAEETEKAIFDALNMPLSQQHARMKKMRESVKNYNVYRWAAEFIRAVASFD